MIRKQEILKKNNKLYLKYRFISLFILSLVLFLLGSGVSQESVRDSIHKSKYDQILVLRDSASMFSDTNPEIAMGLSQKALQLAKEINDIEQQIIVNTDIGINYFYLSNYEKTLHYFKNAHHLILKQNDTTKFPKSYVNLAIIHKDMSNFSSAKARLDTALHYAEYIRDPSEIASVYHNYSTIEENLGNMDAAIKYALKALAIFEESNIKTKTQEVLNNLCIMYGKLEDYEKSLEFAERAYDMAKKINDLKAEAFALNNLGILYKKRGEYNKAMVYQKRSMKIKQKIGNKYGISTSLDNIASIYFELKNYDSASYFFQKATVLLTQIQDHAGLARIHIGMGKVHLAVKNYTKAEEVLKKALKLARKVGTKDYIKDAAIELSNLYYETGNFQKSYMYYDLYAIFKDSIHNEKSARQIAELQARYDTKKKENQIQILRSDRKLSDLKLETQKTELKKRRTNMYLYVSLTFLAAFSGLIYFNRYKHKQQLNKNEMEIRNMEFEQKLLRAQMNPHFIFNSLNSIQGYIALNEANAAEQYLTKFARLMHLIMTNSNKSFISLSEDIETLYLNLSLEQMRFENKFEYVVSVGNGLNPDEILLPPMLVQPFVENSIIHGMKTKESDGLIRLEYSKSGTNLICDVTDNGIGRDAAKKNNRSTSYSKTSLGMKVTEERMEFLRKLYKTNIEIRIEDLYETNHEPAGTHVRIVLPLITGQRQIKEGFKKTA